MTMAGKAARSVVVLLLHHPFKVLTVEWPQGQKPGSVMVLCGPMSQ